MRKLERAYRHTDARQVAGSSQHTYWVTRASLGILWTRSSSTLRIQATLPWDTRRDARRGAASTSRPETARGTTEAARRCAGARPRRREGCRTGRRPLGSRGRTPPSPRGAPRAPSVGRRPATQASGESERLSRVLRRRRRVHKEEGRRVAEAKKESAQATRASLRKAAPARVETRCRSPSPPEMAHIDE